MGLYNIFQSDHLKQDVNERYLIKNAQDKDQSPKRFRFEFENETTVRRSR